MEKTGLDRLQVGVAWSPETIGVEKVIGAVKKWYHRSVDCARSPKFLESISDCLNKLICVLFL